MTATTLRFDREDNQVFLETSMPEQSMRRYLFNRPQSGHRKTIRLTQPKGAGSLVQTAVNVCLQHIDDLDRTHFKVVPWHLARLIWDEVYHSGQMSLKSHVAFSAAYPEEFLASEWEEVINADDLPSPRFVDSLRLFLRKEAFRHLTFLSLGGVFSIDDLMSLLHLEHLGVLFLGDSPLPSVIDDRDVRSWGRAIREKAAFRQLRVFAWGLSSESHPPTHAEVLEAVSDCPELLLVRLDRGESQSGFDLPFSSRDVKSTGTELWEPVKQRTQGPWTGLSHLEVEYSKQFLPVEETMKKIYRAASDHFDKTQHSRLICITYKTFRVYTPRTGTPQIPRWKGPQWYTRRTEPLEKKAERGEKRPAPSDASGNDPNKKPRPSVRPDKKQDLASVLGSFL